MTAAVDARAVLAAAVERAVIDGHDGRSGSTLERVRLADGTGLVLKRSRPGTDLAALVTGGVDRELALFETGVLDRLPSGVGHALVGGWREDGEVVLLMRDVGPAIPGWGRILDRDECRRVLAAAAGVHRTFVAGSPIAAPVAAGVRATALWPHRMRPLVGMANPLPGIVLRGWSRFAELVAGPVADAVARLQADPAPLVAAVDRRPATLLHGDLWLVNLALEPGQVTLLDWSLATWGPPLMEFATFLTGAFSQVADSGGARRRRAGHRRPVRFGRGPDAAARADGAGMEQGAGRRGAPRSGQAGRRSRRTGVVGRPGDPGVGGAAGDGP